VRGPVQGMHEGWVLPVARNRALSALVGRPAAGDRLRNVAFQPWLPPQVSPVMTQRAEGEEDEIDAYEAVRTGQFTLLWTDHALIDAGYGLESVFAIVPPASKCPSPSLPSFQIINHLPGADALVTKDGLLRSINASLSSSSAPVGHSHVFDVCPTSFLIQAGPRVDSTPAWNEFSHRVKDLVAGGHSIRMPAKHCRANLWALKPVKGAGGTGIRIFSDVNVILAALRRRSGDYLLQKVIERPLLLSGRKATLHTYVLITDTLDAYMWRGAFARLSSVAYHVASADAPLSSSSGAGALPSRVSAQTGRWIHVTSSAAQEDCEDNEAYEPGNILPLRTLIAAVDSAGAFARGAVLKALLPRMRRIVADAVRGAAPWLRKGCSGRRCFEILGADFVVDDDLRPWLVGMSECPSMDGPTHEQEENVRLMMQQAVAIAIDPLCPAAVVTPRGDDDSGLRWEAPPGPPTGPDAVANNVSRTQRAGAEGGEESSTRDVSAFLGGPSPGSRHIEVTPLGPYHGFDLVFRAKDVPPVLEPREDEEFEAACEANDHAAKRAILASEAVHEATVPARANAFVPARGLVPGTQMPAGLKSWWKKQLGLTPGEVVESEASASPAAPAPGDVAEVEHAESVSTPVRATTSTPLTGKFSSVVSFPRDPSPLKQQQQQHQQHQHRSPRQAPASPSLHSVEEPVRKTPSGSERVKTARAHAGRLMESARRAAALLRDLKNRAEAAAVSGVAPKDSVSSATISQLEGLVMRLSGEAKAALAAASSSHPPTPVSTARSRSQASSRPVSPGGRSTHSSHDHHGSVSGGDSHRERLRRVRSRVDTGQRTTTPGLSELGKSLRKEAARASQDRQIKASLRGRSRSAHSPKRSPSGRAMLEDILKFPDHSPLPSSAVAETKEAPLPKDELPEPEHSEEERQPAKQARKQHVEEEELEQHLEVKEDSPLPASNWQVWIETPTPVGSTGPAVYYYRASDRVVQWERPMGANVLVMTRSEAAQRAAKSLGD
jgi:hypothetical protein